MKHLFIFIFSFHSLFCSAEPIKNADTYAYTLEDRFDYKGESIALTTYRRIGEESIDKRILDSGNLIRVQEEFSYLDKNLFMGFFHDLEKQTSVYGVYELQKDSEDPKLILEGGYVGFSYRSGGELYAVVNPKFNLGTSSSSLHRFEINANGEVYAKELFSIEDSIIADIIFRDEQFIVSGFKNNQPFALVATGINGVRRTLKLNN